MNDIGTGFIEYSDTLLDPLLIFRVYSDIAGSPFLQCAGFFPLGKFIHALKRYCHIQDLVALCKPTSSS